ncbi:SusC/RagA family TonB-linked outer membrane protein [Niabella drilacis]|uniref:TonB-linked outer membrane protein, SusC/RagA family n=1 Tax=Niabella drilacis (strain DSM 25811 / CCM 8410 / CCUG 62505 / LMG 26954 / E90) TaxID=1285928 RepID=A0A1G6TWY8_NIADE|nr:TonB-dependent receptor [Niabella drilacis]SDD33692.1 TonB-linked outer membrane protein, SusC/RagA family [Niabella drilacis]
MKLKILVFLVLVSAGLSAQTLISGKITDEKGAPLAGASVTLQGTTTAAATNEQGMYQITAPPNGTLLFTSVGYGEQQVAVNNQQTINVSLTVSTSDLGEIVVVGYGSKKKADITSAIASVSADDIARVRGGSTVGTALAGKMAGVSFRMPDGRPGASANIQIRGMGAPLFIIDDIQQDAGQFNNLAQDDIESITVLKDAAASIYGSRAANGVVLVKTKKGRTGQKSRVNVGGYYGWQNWSRFPHTTNAYEWMVGKADAEMTFYGKTDITQAELDKWKAGTEYGYWNEDWRKLIIAKNAPQYSFNVNATGGSEKVNYYVSVTHLDQKGVYGTDREFDFNRTNIQSNIDARISERLKVGLQINGRIETRDQPGVPGVDDYWAARFALFRNRPMELAYANNNKLYPNDIGHNAENWAVQSKALTGYWRSDWRVLQSNFNAEYQVPGIKGLTASGKYSYYLADNVTNGHEYTYDVYTYHPESDTYEKKVGSSNPYRERILEKVFNNVFQAQLDYSRSFGDHNIAALFLNERIERKHLRTFQHAVPKVNGLPIMFWNDMDGQNFADIQEEEARVGYVLKLNYNYASRYYLEFAGRRDASWKFAPDRRVGYFPSVSAAWRLTQERFFQNLIGENSVLNELKIRGSYGILGDDNIGIGPFDYLVGYQYNTGVAILDGVPITTSTLRNSGIKVDNVSWFESRITDLGVDLEFFDHKLQASADYFYRKRTGLLGTKYDILLPSEIGYGLPRENVNSDARFGAEGSVKYSNNSGKLGYSVGGNISISRAKFLESYKPIFFNSWDQYRNSAESRYSDIFWGYEVTGQFRSFEEINNYPVNIDGEGNRTLRPGSFIYKDQNGDGSINELDERPIGYTTQGQPNIQYGLQIGLNYRNFNFNIDFSGGALYSWNQNWEMRWPYQNTGALRSEIYNDRWHREDIFDLNSAWIPGKYPAISFNESWRSDYNKNSTFWLHNIKYLRARTIELGYSLPQQLIKRLKINGARFYINGYNLFSIDNIKKLETDPEIADDNGLQYPQNKFVNIGFNLSL